MEQAKPANAFNIEGANAVLMYVGTPDECPICHVGIQPKVTYSVFYGVANTDESLLQIVFYCTKEACNNIFIATYKREPQRDGSSVYCLRTVSPKSAEKHDFGEQITKVSKDFVEIYNQAIAAEAAELDQIAGIGLRKALEFLIKDFSVNQHPTELAKIQSTELGLCINQYCDDIRLKSAASRAAWLGNDEAHYTRRWIDKDITDLKTLIRLSVNWIENVLLTQEYDKGMDPSKKSSASPA